MSEMKKNDLKGVGGCLLIIVILAIGAWQLISPIGPSRKVSPRVLTKEERARYDDMVERGNSDSELSNGLLSVAALGFVLREEYKINIPFENLVNGMSEDELRKFPDLIAVMREEGSWDDCVKSMAADLRPQYGTLD